MQKLLNLKKMLEVTMHRVSFILIFIFVSCLNGYSIVNKTETNLYNFKSTTDPYDSVVSEKEDNDIDNILREYGPITICADRAIYNSDKEILTYYDNIFVMQIHNKHIVCKKPKNEEKGVIYFSRNKLDNFKKLQQNWFAQAKKLCASERECNFISGQKLTINLDKKNKARMLTMESKEDERSQLYIFPKNSQDDKTNKKITKGPLSGTAKKIIYDVVKKKLKLCKKATVSQNDNYYKGEKIIYDMNFDLITIPGSKNNRSRIILDDIQDDTKIDTGLTPINEHNKNIQ